MALPTLSKGGVTTVTFSRSNVYPSVSPKVLNQFVGISDANTIRVASVGPPLQSIVLHFELLTREDRDNIETFFADSLVNYGQNTFQFTDANETVHNCRFLDTQLALPEVTDDNVSFELTLTKV
jgi:hypothetical protein